MRKPISNRARLHVERLEGRELMAGNVVVDLDPNGLLKVTGDGQDNQISIVRAKAGAVVVTALNSTRINGGLNSIRRDGVISLQVFMYAGADQVTIESTNLTRMRLYEFLNVDMGLGADHLEITGVSASFFTISGGNGDYDDTIDMLLCDSASYAKISGHGGRDTITLDTCSIITKLTVDTDSGNDVVELRDIRAKEIWIPMGEGDDTLRADGLYCDTPAVLDPGPKAGWDTLRLSNYVYSGAQKPTIYARFWDDATGVPKQ